jgi:Na+/proline symporter
MRGGHGVSGAGLGHGLAGNLAQQGGVLFLLGLLFGFEVAGALIVERLGIDAGGGAHALVHLAHVFLPGFLGGGFGVGLFLAAMLPAMISLSLRSARQDSK